MPSRENLRARRARNGRVVASLLGAALLVITTGATTLRAQSSPGGEAGASQAGDGRSRFEGVPSRFPSAQDPAARDQAGRFKRPRGDRPLPDGRIARGSRNIRAAWLSGPTNRYRHYVLGSEHEAETLWIATDQNRNHSIKLTGESVFEDREPRIVDLDGDGVDEVVVIKSTRTQGAQLVVAALSGEGFQITAQTEPVGRTFRWLNPAGFADFDGDGRLDIALVEAPHVDGILQLWTLQNGRLVQTFESAARFASNHVAGSGALKLSAVADFDGDGVADLALPTFDRRSLQIVSLKGRRMREITREALPGPAVDDFRVIERGGRRSIEVGLAGGRKALVSP